MSRADVIHARPLSTTKFAGFGLRDGWITAVPQAGEIAGEWDTSLRAVQRAKKLLADYGVIKRDQGGYYLP